MLIHHNADWGEPSSAEDCDSGRLQIPFNACVIVPTEDASIQKIWEKLGINQKQRISSMVKYLLVKHILDGPQTNLSLSNPPHAIQQEEFSMADIITAFSSKMFLQFCENICVPCEPNTWVWFYGDHSSDVALLTALA